HRERSRGADGAGGAAFTWLLRCEVRQGWKIHGDTSPGEGPQEGRGADRRDVPEAAGQPGDRRLPVSGDQGWLSVPFVPGVVCPTHPPRAQIGDTPNPLRARPGRPR